MCILFGLMEQSTAMFHESRETLAGLFVSLIYTFLWYKNSSWLYKRKAIMKIEWYQSDDLILGFCGFKGSLGVYRFFLDRSGEWQFCPPETRIWDCYHQKVYLQGRADPCSFSDLADRVPPLPAQFPPPQNFHTGDPPEPPTPNVLPGSWVFEKVKDAPNRRLSIYVVLKEDTYESAVGDGIFRYFKSAHFDRKDAKSNIKKELKSSEFYSYHIRKIYLIISDNEVILDIKGCDLSPFDHFTRQQICDDLAKRIT